MASPRIEQVVDALNRSRTRYLVMGGVAVVAHGFVRATSGLDLVIDPDPVAMHRAIDVLSKLGYRPRAPVPVPEGADLKRRRALTREEQCVVFSISSDQQPATDIVLHVDPSFDFARTYSNAARLEVGQGIVGTFVSRADLIAMKRRAGRPQDLADLAGLEQSSP